MNSRFDIFRSDAATDYGSSVVGCLKEAWDHDQLNILCGNGFGFVLNQSVDLLWQV